MSAAERPSAVPLAGDAERVASKLIETLGPAAAAKVAWAVIALVEPIGSGR